MSKLGVIIIAPDTIERTKQLHALSPKILMESDNILFPELGYQYQQDPTDPNLVLLSEVGVQKRIAKGYYEEGLWWTELKQLNGILKMKMSKSCG
jgi:hypothetical protein